jgi:heme exporter protein A
MLYLGHQDAVKPWLTVGENLAFWAALFGATAAMQSALDRLGLGAHAAAPARYLSAGQRRRLALARLAAIPARLWLLDEPTTGLDDANVGVVESLIAEHCRAGGMAIVSTHLPLGLPGSLGLELGAAS